MDLEEHTIEDLPQTCAECGAPLSEEEQAVILEEGGPPLCSIHAAEALAVDDDGDDLELE